MPTTKNGTLNHGVCLIEQATPSATGPSHLDHRGPRRVTKSSQRRAASIMNGTNRASVPPWTNVKVNNDVRSSSGESHFAYQGDTTYKMTAATIHAKRSIQSAPR
jgi:hypothetical protein